MFDNVNNNWKRTTKELFESGNAYKGAHIDGMLGRLSDMLAPTLTPTPTLTLALPPHPHPHPHPHPIPNRNPNPSPHS